MAFFKRENPASSPKTAAYMTFRVGGQLYAIPIHMVSEIVAPKGLSPLRGSDPAIVGELELRGSALVVVDMGLRLRGVPVTPTPSNCILIVRRKEARSGCLLDAPGDIVKIPEAALSGCLVESPGGIAAIPEEERKTPENASVSGASHGFPLYKTGDEIILLPPGELCYPK